MTDKSKDIQVMNTLHSTAAGKKLAYADEVYLDGYDDIKIYNGQAVRETDSVSRAIKRVEERISNAEDDMNTKEDDLLDEIDHLRNYEVLLLEGGTMDGGATIILPSKDSNGRSRAIAVNSTADFGYRPSNMSSPVEHGITFGSYLDDKSVDPLLTIGSSGIFIGSDSEPDWEMMGLSGDSLVFSNHDSTAKSKIREIKVVNTGIYISEKTSSDLLHAAGGTTKIKTINKQSLLTDTEADLVIDKTFVGLDKVDNTSDAEKPVSTATQEALNKKADLDDTGKVPSSQLPSYVDAVLEYDNLAGFPADGESGKIYVAKDTNLTYRWSGTAYIEVSPSLAIGETASTAFAGNRGKAVEDSVAAIKAKTDAIPENPKYTDTTYGEATSTTAGLMSVKDKGRLDNLSNFGSITHVLDDGAFIKSASDVKLAFECTTADTAPANRSHHEVSIGAASADNAGVMTAADKIKLDGYPSYSELQTTIKDLQDKITALTTQVETLTTKMTALTPKDGSEFVLSKTT